ncbi:small integral membrane protein 26 [Hippoglossus stenolepis]|uniref:small integral membrane protein 26 n=1 Tax=Hippoglossus stenolepis TaxID=195615 RepID=UPI001FAF2AD5|nr:small integral membrane protein 26 [Hippoglossus stenolepis]
MKLDDVLKWNKRVSAVYAVGIWTMIGSYAYSKYTGRNEDKPAKREEKVEEDPKQVVYVTAHTKTIIVYKEDFVPYSTRIYNFIKSFGGGPGSGDRDK